jgi:hypothetical protein
MFAGWLLQCLLYCCCRLLSSQRPTASCPLTPPFQFASCLPASCCLAPFVVLLPPLVLLMRRLHLMMCHRLLSTSPPGCLLFAGWLLCRIFLCCLHLASSFVAPLPHMSILDPPPSCASSASHPLVNTAPSQHAAALHCTGNSTSCSPLVHHNWLPHFPGVSQVSAVAKILQNPFSDCTC